MLTSLPQSYVEIGQIHELLHKPRYTWSMSRWQFQRTDQPYPENTLTRSLPKKPPSVVQQRSKTA